MCVCFFFVIFNESESYIKESTRSYPSNRSILPKKREKLAQRQKSTYPASFTSHLLDCAHFFLSFEVALMNSVTPLHSNIIQGYPPIQTDSVFCNELNVTCLFIIAMSP